MSTLALPTIKKLPGLNALRAIAASVVLIGHVYQISGLMGLGLDKSVNYHVLGSEMVNLFFVISGFIITYILLHEKENTGTIRLNPFYYKRILRIWPIYFLIFFGVCLLQLFTGAYDSFNDPLTFKSFIVFLFFLVSMNEIFFYVGLSVLPHYWSLSVEELFYLYWPIVVDKMDIVKFSLLLIIGWILMRNAFAFLGGHGYGAIYMKLNQMAQMLRFPSMSIGALGAYAVVNNRNWFARVIGKKAKFIFWTLFILMTALRPVLYIPYIHNEVLALLYLLLLLNVINNRPDALTESKVLNETGKISYGIYMYHWPVIPVLIILLKKWGLINYFTAYYYLPLVVLSYIVVWAISYVSFYYFESYFLNLKYRNEKRGVLREAISGTNP